MSSHLKFLITLQPPGGSFWFSAVLWNRLLLGLDFYVFSLFQQPGGASFLSQAGMERLRLKQHSQELVASAQQCLDGGTTGLANFCPGFVEISIAGG